MLPRLALIATLLAGMPVAGAQKLAINVTVAAQVAKDRSLARTLESALRQSLAARSRSLPAGHTIDVSLVRLDTAPVSGGEVEVRVEVRAAISDARGKIHAVTSTRAIARGPVRDRGLVTRDAISEAAGQLGKRLVQR